MSIMIDRPTEYFSQWIPNRSELLKKLESEAADQNIPIVGPVVGRLLAILVLVKKARRILELGTATGYSAIFMGEACRQNNGQIFSFEYDERMAQRAKTNIDLAGLHDVIEVRCQEAAEALAAFEQPVDMVFMDIEKMEYVKLLPALERIIEPEGLLVVDNTGFQDAHAFNRAVHESSAWACVNLWAYLPGHSPENDGICIAARAQ